MATEFLAMHNKFSGTIGNGVAVFRVLNATSAQVGNGFARREQFSSQFTFGLQRVVQFKGAEDLYAGTGSEGGSAGDDGGVYKYNPSTSNWDQVVSEGSFTEGFDTTMGHLFVGPYVVFVNGEPHLAVLAPGNNNARFQGARSVDGSTWSFSAASDFSGSVDAEREADCWNSHVFGNAIYTFIEDDVTFSATEGWFAVSYDPAAQSVSLHTVDSGLHGGGGSNKQAAVCFLNGRRWLINSWPGGGADEPPVVVEWPAGQNISSSLNRLVLESGGTPFGNNRCALFTDGTFLYALYYYQSVGDSGGGWHMMKLQESGAGLAIVSDLTDVVLPASVGRNSGAGGHFTWMFDQEVNPGGVPEIRLYHDSGASWDVYKWNGDSALIGAGGSPNDSGATDGIMIPGGPNSDDQPIWWSDGPDGGSVNIEFEPATSGDVITPALGGERLRFKIYGPLGTETVNVRVFFGEDDEFQFQQASLSDASHGTIVSDEIQGLTADGSTIYAVTAGYPGVTTGEPITTQLYVEIQP